MSQKNIYYAFSKCLIDVERIFSGTRLEALNYRKTANYKQYLWISVIFIHNVDVAPLDRKLFIIVLFSRQYSFNAIMMPPVSVIKETKERWQPKAFYATMLFRVVIMPLVNSVKISQSKAQCESLLTTMKSCSKLNTAQFK